MQETTVSETKAFHLQIIFTSAYIALHKQIQCMHLLQLERISRWMQIPFLADSL